MSAPSLNVAIQGQGVLFADWINSFALTCDNVAQLRAFVGTTGMQVYTRGITTPGDGGQGFFYWSSTATAADNGETVIVPTGASSGAWLRISSDSVLLTPTTITASGGTTLPAANLVGGIILRAGSPGTGFNDTTDTATAIINAMTSSGVGASFSFRYINQTGQTSTLVGGSGVTITGPATTAASASHTFIAVVTGTSTLTIYG